MPDLIAGLITVLVHLWRRSMFLSLIVGTVSYILLINFAF
nr:AzlD domain-containing protein [Limosilactobacillus kribbianus]